MAVGVSAGSDRAGDVIGRLGGADVAAETVRRPGSGAPLVPSASAGKTVAGCKGRCLSAWGMIRRAAVDHPAGLLALWGIAFAALLCLPVVTLSLTARRVPNDVRLFDLGGWLRDVATLAMPLSERLSYIFGQPIVEVGMRDGAGMVFLSYPLAVHNLVTFAGLSGFMAVYTRLLRGHLRGRRARGGAKGSAAASGAVCAAVVSGLSGASLTAAGCCGGVIGPALLSLFGLGAGLSDAVVNTYGGLGEVAGGALMLASIVYLADRSRPSHAFPGHGR